MAVSPVQDMFPAPVGYCGTPLPQGTGDRLQRESVSRRCAPAMDSSGGYPLVGSRYIQGKCKLVQKGKCVRAFSDRPWAGVPAGANGCEQVVHSNFP